MRILIIMDPGIPVPPVKYGGHERLVYMFAEEYINQGHEVTLFAGPDSFISGSIYSFGSNDLKRNKLARLKELFATWKFIFLRRKDFDLIHNFGRLAYIIPLLNHSVKKIMTYGRQINSSNIKRVLKFRNQNLKFTAPSYDCMEGSSQYGNWTRIFNAIDFSKYKLTTKLDIDAPLIFLSRLDKVKGCHIAIEIAKRTNQSLIIAGNISNLESEIEYFKNEIEPHIDGIQIKYVGAVNDEEKNHYLGKSKAMLFPIDIREAFGMVMAESMACGTPVIAFKMGSVKEVICEEVSGFIVRDKVEMIAAINKINLIDRTACRTYAEKIFDVKVIAKEYTDLFN